jgi:hypothetical protein
VYVLYSFHFSDNLQFPRREDCHFPNKTTIAISCWFECCDSPQGSPIISRGDCQAGLSNHSNSEQHLAFVISS